jgi:lipopolysaccharide biosynthesis regulator YciM
LEKIIEKAESMGESKNGTKRQLLNLYCKNKNLEKAIELKNVSIFYIILKNSFL